MYKVKSEHLTNIMKTHDINEVFFLLDANKKIKDWTFFKDYEDISREQLLLDLLTITRDFKKYMTLYKIFNPLKTIHEYHREQLIGRSSIPQRQDSQE